MTTRSALKQPHNVNYSHLEPLPDPPREKDMEQFDHLIYAGSSPRAYFADRDDILGSVDIYDMGGIYTPSARRISLSLDGLTGVGKSVQTSMSTSRQTPSPSEPAPYLIRG